MGKYISLFSEPLHKTYVTNSKLSSAYFFYILFWIAVIFPPVVLVVTLAKNPKLESTLVQPSVQLTGNYFFSFNGIEASSSNPSSNFTFRQDAIDLNKDKKVDVIELSFIGSTSNDNSALYAAVELVDESGAIGIAKLVSVIPSRCNRAQADFTLDYSHELNLSDSPANLSDVLKVTGQKGIFKVMSAFTPYKLSTIGFGTVCQTFIQSNSLSVAIRIHVPPIIKFNRPSNGDIVRENILYFVIYLLVNYFILNFIIKLVIKAGLVKMKVIVQYDLAPKLS